MIKILYDHQKFSTQYFGGISRYFATIMDSIRNGTDFGYETGVLYSTNQYLKKEDKVIDNKLADQVFSRLVPPSLVYKLNQRNCTRLIKKADFDVFHPTYYDPYFLPDLRKPLVITIHDMTYERMPEYFWAKDPLSQQKRLNIERADLIIAISESTKNDLIELSDIKDPDKIHVVHHGIDLDTPLETTRIATLPEHYILFVGDRSGYKNFYLLLAAFKELSQYYPDLRLVLAGGGTLDIAEWEAINRHHVKDKIVHFRASDAELNYLYQNASLFVYPSLYEGFGLPILEAFRAGCPVLLSDTACFREIAREGASYFEPTRKDSLIDQIRGILDSTSLQNSLKEKGKQRLQDFPIEACIQKTLALYQTLT